MNKRATENYILKFQTVSSVSSDSIVKEIIDDIINTAMKTAEVVPFKQNTNAELPIIFKSKG
jgi:hypothetical protein